MIECYREPLSKNGLALVQPIIQRDGHLVLMTKILHTSGEWIASEFPLKAYDRPQEQGSAITYARRYTVSALLGIAAEDDDDGKRAQEATPRSEEPQPVSADAAAIVHLAAELAQVTGDIDPATIIREASSFPGKDGKEMYFTDPTKVRSVKWLKSVREKLERELQKKSALAAVGDADVPF